MDGSRRARLAAGLIVAVAAVAVAVALWLRVVAPAQRSPAAELRDKVERIKRASSFAPLSTLLREAAAGEAGEAGFDPEAIAQRTAALSQRIASAGDERVWRSGAPPAGQGDAVATPRQRQAMAQLVAQWLALRATEDVDGYVAWMRRQGFSWSDEEPSLSGKDVGYRWLTGKDLTPEVSREELFRTLWLGLLRAFDGALRPVAIGPVELRFGLCDAQRRNLEDCLMPDEPLDRWWIGWGVGAARRHFTPARSLEEVLQRQGKALASAAFVMTRGADGGLVSYKVYAFWDPQAGRWTLESVHFIPLERNALNMAMEM